MSKTNYMFFPIGKGKTPQKHIVRKQYPDLEAARRGARNLLENTSPSYSKVLITEVTLVGSEKL